MCPKGAIVGMIVTQLFIYPIKSAHYISVDDAEVNLWGLRDDRRWMVVDESARFLTQREEPRLALVQAKVTPTGVMLEAPGMPQLLVPFPTVNSGEESVVVWKDAVKVVVATTQSCNWFTKFLGRPCKLVYMHDPFARSADTAYARPGSVVSFADGYPLLLTSEASLNDLNGRMQAPIPMIRFRPNVVIDGRIPFEEDWWQRIRIGGVIFDVVKPCTRCVITTIDQDSAHNTNTEPLRTLNTFRKKDGKVYFGENLVPDGPGEIHVGDDVELLERRNAPMPQI